MGDVIYAFISHNIKPIRHIRHIEAILLDTYESHQHIIIIKAGVFAVCFISW